MLFECEIICPDLSPETGPAKPCIFYPHLPEEYKVGNFIKYITPCGNPPRPSGENIKVFKNAKIRVPFYKNASNIEQVFINENNGDFDEWKIATAYKDKQLNSIWAITARLNNEKIYRDIQNTIKRDIVLSDDPLPKVHK